MNRPTRQIMDVSIVIPFFNEEGALPELFEVLEEFLRDARQYRMGVEILFVDDGSEDKSLELVRARFGKRARVQILSWARNRGVGYAIRNGFARAANPAVVCYDSDATYPLSQVFSMVSALESADVVTASPFMEGGGFAEVSFHRLALSRLLSFLYARLPGGKSLSTYSCGFRAYRKECLAEIAFRANGFLATTEILCRAMERGLRIQEVPSTLSGRRHGRSKMPLFRTALAHLQFLGSLYLRALFRFFRRGAKRKPEEEGCSGPSGEPGRGGGSQGELAAWNARLNAAYPMDKLLESRNPLVRFAERRRRKVLCGLAGQDAGGTLVDLGPERGGIASALCSRFRRVCCVDIDRNVLKVARQRIKASTVSFVQGDIQALGLRSGLANVTLASAVLEHVPDPAEGLAEAVRVTQREGKVVLCIPHDSLILKINGVLRALRLGRILCPSGAQPAPGHLHVLDRNGIIAMIPETMRIQKFFLHLPSLCYFLLLIKEG